MKRSADESAKCEALAAKTMANLPGGASGLLMRVYKGKKADRVVARIDTRILSLFAELRAHERQAAEELGQWRTGVKESEPRAASSTASITLRFTLSLTC